MKSIASILLTAKVITEPTVISNYGLEEVLECKLQYRRPSGTSDTFLLNFQKSLGVSLKVNDIVNVRGELRSSNLFDESGKHYIKVYVFGSSIKILASEPENCPNRVKITNAFLIKDAVERTSYNDKSIPVTELKLRIPRSKGRETIVACSCWNSIAKLTATKARGDIISLEGRLQSHKLSNGADKVEISVFSVKGEDTEDNENPSA